MTVPTNSRPPASGRAWIWGVTGGYLLFAAATLGFVAFALTQDTELVSPDYYQRGTAHQAHMDATSRALALPDSLAWTVALKGGQVTCRFARADIQGRFHLYRPADAALDRRLDIALQDGAQTLSTDLAPGRWILQIDWTMDGLAYHSRREFRVER